MKTLAGLALIVSLLLQTTSAQYSEYSLSPSEIPHLIGATNYTFHALCDTLQNPDPFFDETKVQTILYSYTNDLSMYLQGAWSAASTTTEKDDSPRNFWNYLTSLNNVKSGVSRIWRQAPFQPVPQSGGELDCASFQVNLLKFSVVFQDMAYAISEKCYRQCKPYSLSHQAVTQLRNVFERSPYGSFYQQVRMIEEVQGCSFEDTFLVEPERAIDRVQLWLRDYKSLRSPCADLAKAHDHNDRDGAAPLTHPQPILEAPPPPAEPTSLSPPSIPPPILHLKTHASLPNIDPLASERAARKQAIQSATGAIILEEDWPFGDRKDFVVSIDGTPAAIQAALDLSYSLREASAKRRGGRGAVKRLCGMRLLYR